MKTYTYDETLALLQEAVSERGEHFIYEQRPEPGPSCRYAWDGKPDCIVGHVFAKVGVPVQEMLFGDKIEDYNGVPNRGKYSSEGADSVVENLESDGVVSFTPRARRLLLEVQNKQDYGMTWGDSLAGGVHRTKHLKESEKWAPSE